MSVFCVFGLVCLFFWLLGTGTAVPGRAGAAQSMLGEESPAAQGFVGFRV